MAEESVNYKFVEAAFHDIMAELRRTRESVERIEQRMRERDEAASGQADMFANASRIFSRGSE
jgi:hypothetical protein